MIYNNSIEMIGNTPMLKINDDTNSEMANVYLKLEKFNPGGSVKDRAALGMIEEAERQGKLKKGVAIVEPTSGNTGIAIAMIGRIKGYKVIIVMPDTMSIERRSLIKAYGAELVLTEGTKGMKGAIEKATEIASGKSEYFIPQQFENTANPAKHYVTTAEEIIKDVPDIDAFVAGVGTGGTITGVGRKLKEYNKNIIVNAVEPEKSPVLSGGNSGSHKIQGIGAGFIPEIYDGSVVDRITRVSDEDAFKAVREFANKQGIILGISSGAAIHAALKLAKELGRGKTVVAVAPDGGEKYISMGVFD